jgi:cobalt transporter subunit CbtB
VATTASRPIARLDAASRERLTAALVALLLGTFLLFGAGFAPLPALHEAAHDARHGFAFPCH